MTAECLSHHYAYALGGDSMSDDKKYTDMEEIDDTKLEAEEEEGEYEEVCMMCHRPESKAGRMVHMPGNVCICDDCMHRTMDMVNDMQESGILDSPEFQRQMAEFEKQMFHKSLEKPKTPGKAKPAEAQDGMEDGEEPQDGEEADNGRPQGFPKGFPQIRFINMADLQGGMPEKQKLKKKKKNAHKKPSYSFRAFLIALLAFFGISIGNDMLSENTFDSFGNANSATNQTDNANGTTESSSADTFRVHILDVGQGLAVLIEAGEDTLLYDGGGADTSSFVVSYLQKLGISDLDYCIASHYDADHLSGIVGALHKFETGILIAPDYTYDTKTYYSFLNIAAEKSLPIHSPTPGECFPLGNGTIEILAPKSDFYEDENDYSVVVKVSIGDSSLLLTGDATTVSETEMLSANAAVDADVLVLGHHGSYNSTGDDFFRAVSPESTIISCGRGNDYGHPHTRIMNLLKENATSLYRTDLQGMICFTMTCDKIVFDKLACQDYATGDEVRYEDYTSK